MTGESAVQRRVVIVEPAHTGHRLHYVRTLADKAADASIAAVLATSSETLASDEFQRVLRTSNIECDVCASFNGGLRRRWRDVRRIEKALRSGDVLIFPNVDEYILPLVLHSVTNLRIPVSRVTGIVMRPPDSLKVKDLIKRLLIAWLRVRHARMYVLRSPLANEDRAIGEHVIFDDSGLMQVAQQPDSTLSAALAAWKGEDVKPIATILGVLDRRKSIAEVLDAVELSGRFRVLLAGQLSDPSVANKVASTVGRLRQEDICVVARYLTDEEFEAVLANSDVLCLLYTNSSGSSGLVAHAMRRQIPVLAFGNVTVTRIVQRYGAGTVIGDLNPVTIATGITECRKSRDAPLEMVEQFLQVAGESWDELFVRAIHVSSIS